MDAKTMNDEQFLRAMLDAMRDNDVDALVVLNEEARRRFIEATGDDADYRAFD
jgi:hypothetical protein